MLAEVGLILIFLSLFTSLYAAFAAFWGIRQSDPRWAESSRNSIHATTALLGLALVALLIAFLDDQFQIRYVYENSSLALPISLKISALWAGQDGSLLLWSFLQALFATLVIIRPSEKARPLIPWATIFLNVTTAFFVGITLFLSNPFTLLEVIPSDGLGLNPLLRHPGMIFHPPALYVGYVGLAVPFAFAMAALITRRIEDWTAASRRWTLAAWLFLGLGLLLGARWAYDVLGWGGYWGWDPVENAGLMPWLTATALLHSAVMQEQRGGFRVWNVMMAVFSFALVLFGTFTTRSGMIQSVHAFPESGLGQPFLIAIGITLILPLVLVISRASLMRNPKPEEGLLSRQGLFFITLLLFTTVSISVWVGSVLPTITEALTNQRFSANTEWFDRVTGPQFALMVFVLGLCPILGRTASTLKRLRERSWPGLAGAILVTVAAALLGFTNPFSLIGFFATGLAGGTAIAEILRDGITRSRSQKESFGRALWTMMDRNHRRYGGYLVHIGIVLISLGLIGTRMYPFEEDIVVSYGDAVEIKDYTLVYEWWQDEPAVDHTKIIATVSVYRNNTFLGSLEPRREYYLNTDQPTTVPALRAGIKEDLYIILAGWENSGETAVFKVFVNPLVSYLWIGSLVFLAGGTIAVWPKAHVPHLSPSKLRQRVQWNVVGLSAILLALLITGVWILTIGHWTDGNLFSAAAGRPLPGQEVPDFDLELFDGSLLTMSELRGQVVVLNIWASWCPSCQDEMPALEAVWQEYQPQGVTLVGIAYQDTEADARTSATAAGITYPLGIDEGDQIFSSYGATGVPETYIIDAEGKLAYFHLGTVTAARLREELDSLLQ